MYRKKMNFVSKTLFLLFVAKAANAKLRAEPMETTPDEDSVFWSRHLMSMNVISGSSPDKQFIYKVGQITEEEIPELQKSWGGALVDISDTYNEKGFEAAKELAQSVLDSAYCYKMGIPVLFKPTLTYGDQTFRNTEEGALAYFVGGNDKYPNDKGFALKNWTKVESFPETWVLFGDTAFSQGKVKITNKDGDETVVDKTWGYKKKSDGSTCIMLHHSSLPYVPPTST